MTINTERCWDFQQSPDDDARRHCVHIILLPAARTWLESDKKNFIFSVHFSTSFFHSKQLRLEKQPTNVELCNFQQIEFLFLFDGDYSVAFSTSLLFSDFIFPLDVCMT